MKRVGTGIVRDVLSVYRFGCIYLELHIEHSSENAE